MPEYGTLLGLAQSFDADQRINDLYRQEEANNRAKAMAEAKAKMLADDVKYQNAANAYDNKIIKEYAQQRIQEIGDWVNKNPDYLTDVRKRMQYNALIDDIKTNQHVMRGMATDKALAELNNDLAEVAKNPEMYDQEAYNELLAQRDNYLKFGNQKGIDAATKEGVQPFIYRKPKNFVDLPKTLMGYGSEIKNYDVVKPKGGNIGEYYTKPNDNDLNAIKASAYQQHGRQIAVEARKLGLTTPQQVDDWLTSQISAGFNKHYSIGDANAAYDNYIKSENLKLAKQKAGQELLTNPSYTPFDYIIDPRNKVGQMNPDDVKKIWGDKPVSPLYGNDGTKVDLSGFTVEYDGRYLKKQGLPFFLGKVNMPLDVAEQKGIYKEPFGPNLGRTGTIEPAFLDKARIAEGVDKDGNPMKYVQVDYELPINPNDKVARDKTNAFILPDKLVEPGANPFQQQQSNVPAASLEQWKQAGWSEEQIQRGVNEGKIKVK